MHIVNPHLAIEAARKEKLSVPLALALLSQESGGGKNEWGHDPGAIFNAGQDKLHGKDWGDTVTKASYLAYKAERDALGLSLGQGVGPTQLTSTYLQNQADTLGGAWRPLPNMEVGFHSLQGSIQAYRSVNRALIDYNAGPNASGAGLRRGEDYASEVIRRATEWAKALGMTVGT